MLPLMLPIWEMMVILNMIIKLYNFKNVTRQTGGLADGHSEFVLMLVKV